MRTPASGLLLGIVASILVATSFGCSANRANCQTVKLQREAGRSDAEIASNLGITDADIAKCSGGGGGGGETAPTPEPGAAGGGKPPM